jgi:hypothetical protein
MNNILYSQNICRNFQQTVKLSRGPGIDIISRAKRYFGWTILFRIARHGNT